MSELQIEHWAMVGRAGDDANWAQVRRSNFTGNVELTMHGPKLIMHADEARQLAELLDRAAMPGQVPPASPVLDMDCRGGNHRACIGPPGARCECSCHAEPPARD